MPDEERPINDEMIEESAENEEQNPDQQDESEQAEGIAEQSDDVPEDGAAGEDLTDDGPVDDEPSDDQSESPDVSEEDAERQMLAELENMDEMGDLDSDLGGLSNDFGSDAEDDVEVRQAEFQQLSSSVNQDSPKNLELLLDVMLPISIELGRTTMNVQDILNLGPGSVVELNKLAGEPVDLLVNNKVVAKGEVVVIDENFGLRVTNLMSPEERLKSLGD